jgi:hypothetical protein
MLNAVFSRAYPAQLLWDEDRLADGRIATYSFGAGRTRATFI